jgi:hypothetical protein
MDLNGHVVRADSRAVVRLVFRQQDDLSLGYYTCNTFIWCNGEEFARKVDIAPCKG